MKLNKTIIIILSIIAVIVIGTFSIILYYYSQGSEDNYVPPATEEIEAPVDQAIADMQKIASALETYYAMNFEYPETLAGLVPDVIDSIPLDPVDNKEYVYYTDIDESYSISVPNPKNYNLTTLKMDNGEIVKQ
jgi:hypothetical protein